MDIKQEINTHNLRPQKETTQQPQVSGVQSGATKLKGLYTCVLAARCLFMSSVQL